MRTLVLDNGATITLEDGAQVNIGEDVRIEPNTRIHIGEYLELGDRTVINQYAKIEGRRIIMGRECWIDEYAHIGGGSCMDWQSNLEIGDWLHMGKWSELNPAREVKIGDEVALGMKTVVVSHGAYLSAYEGYPVQWGNVSIGDNVWLPFAWVNPNVVIEDNVVVASMSLVNKNLKSGNLYGGVPVRLLKENVYPRVVTEDERKRLCNSIINSCNVDATYSNGKITTLGVEFNIDERVITGKATVGSERLKNELRRNGIRFRYKTEQGEYVPW